MPRAHLLVAENLLFPEIRIFVIEVALLEIAEEIDQLLFHLERIATGPPGDGFRDFIGCGSLRPGESGFPPFLIAPVTGVSFFGAALAFFRIFDKFRTDPRPGKRLSGKPDRRLDFEIRASAEIDALLVQRIVLIEPLIAPLLVAFSGEGDILPDRLQREFPGILIRNLHAMFGEIFLVVRRLPFGIHPCIRLQDRDNIPLIRLGVFPETKADMFVDTDIIV